MLGSEATVACYGVPGAYGLGDILGPGGPAELAASFGVSLCFHGGRPDDAVDESDSVSVDVGSFTMIVAEKAAAVYGESIPAACCEYSAVPAMVSCDELVSCPETRTGASGTYHLDDCGCESYVAHLPSLTMYNWCAWAEAIRLDVDLYTFLTALAHLINDRYECEIHDPPGTSPDGYLVSIWTSTFDDRLGYF